MLGQKAYSDLCEYIQSFVLGDWSLGVLGYQLDITHSLNTKNLVVEIRQGDNGLIELDRLDFLTQDTIRLYVSEDPDCRFEGTITLIGR
jgi:hypothetical protein